MNSFKDNYTKELRNELEQFLFLCGKKDAKILLTQTERNYSNDHLRLACICMVFGYKRILLKIIALAEKNRNNLFNGLENLNGNFVQLDEWVTDFIKNINFVEAHEIAREFWQDRKKTLNVENFNIKNLLKD